MAWNEPGGNNKDPWGNNNRGNKGGGGNQPPDLDEVIKQLTDKLSGIFGGGGNKNSSQNGDGGFWLMLIIGLIIAAVLLATDAVYTVDTKERAVVLRTGKFQRLETEGLKFKIPVIEQKIIINATEKRSVQISESMLTQDNNIVDVSLEVQYNVSDPVAFALRVEDPEGTLRSAAQSVLRHEAGSLAMDSILTDGRSALADAMEVRLQSYLDSYNTGISISDVNVKETAPPAAVKEAFDDVERARQDKITIVNNAEAYSNAVVPEARGRAQRQLEEARAYKDQVIARAEGEAARFEKLLAEYEKAPAVTRERLYIDAITQVYNSSNKVLVDVEGGNNMMYLPLDKLVQPVKSAASSAGMSTDDISRLTDQVLNELRARQNSNNVRREGR